MEQSCLGIYLGVSNKHASTISLVLTPQTGLVSPQFHVKWDDKFETVGNYPLMKNIGKWQEITQIHKTKVEKEPPQRSPRIQGTTTQELSKNRSKPQRENAIPSQREMNSDGTPKLQDTLQRRDGTPKKGDTSQQRDGTRGYISTNRWHART